jgi:hypothetical protein
MHKYMAQAVAGVLFNYQLKALELTYLLIRWTMPKKICLKRF